MLSNHNAIHKPGLILYQPNDMLRGACREGKVTTLYVILVLLVGRIRVNAELLRVCKS